ncbi:ADP-ribosylation factor protein, putative [Perkinsus marinus ATCC 50983]|uniref:ADP-ribosylation factor protein, putative n=1 Tax=Perkinsus marinus (strain ATCC 50983 / TXsc) TaxID=423536 RepID=C5L3N4_PERM5|nr:ADP-ribosylation factor protein, putative [Perkinsus marinus ATCC 50983]EER08613.1 ADP-ribosylation factor protein, putative [Perkinsus marinus ATCC 50983]|eukprot:XP_002776797.1 ADP-ribosylation factor protein, putative [Perkinsus marinus ATCC 50983]
MFSLISGFYRWLTEREERKLIIVGVDNAGKTTTLEQLKRNHTGKGMELERIPPTVGLNVGRITMDHVDAVFWDVGGQIALRELWSSYYEDCNGIVFVVDSADEKRMRNDVDTAAQVLSDRRLAHKPLALLCNKHDLPDALPSVEVEDMLGLSEQMDRPLKVFSVSALKNEGLEDAIHWLLREASNSTNQAE